MTEPGRAEVKRSWILGMSVSVSKVLEQSISAMATGGKPGQTWSGWPLQKECTVTRYVGIVP